MKNKILFLVLIIMALLLLAFAFSKKRPVATAPQGQENSVSAENFDWRNASFTIDGREVALKDGISEMPAAPGSASKIVTKYFGNELRADLDGDGREDAAFIVTQETGGSGTFYYAVAAINTGQGYVGSDGYLLGDRIAPQPTTLSPNPRQKEVVVFNYADRTPGEPMSAEPSIGKSVYLKIDPKSRQWGIVMPDFEGESR